MARTRLHLTIQEKNQLRAWHRQHPELTQAQLCEWVHTKLGKWVGHSTVGQITRQPEQLCADPTAKRQQRGRYPDVEQELYEFIIATSKAQHPERGDDDSGTADVDVASIVDMTLPELRDTALWAKANDIFKRVRGSDESISVAWIQRFKRRHGLHTKQLRLRRGEGANGGPTTESPPVETEAAVQDHAVSLDSDQPQPTRVAKRQAESIVQEGEFGDGVNEHEMAPPPRKRPTAAAEGLTGVDTTERRRGKTRKHFMPAEDIMLLSETLKIKPWGFTQTMAGWHEVATALRASGLDKAGGACQARVLLLLKKLRAGDAASQRKSSCTVEEHERKLVLLGQVETELAAHRDATAGLDQQSSAQSVSGRARTETGARPLASREDDQESQSRLERMEKQMQQELAAQRLHADRQAEKMERLHREQMEAQQRQHAQLLATIQRQQATMMNLINAVSGVATPVQPQPSARASVQQDSNGI